MTVYDFLVWNYLEFVEALSEHYRREEDQYMVGIVGRVSKGYKVLLSKHTGIKNISDLDYKAALEMLWANQQHIYNLKIDIELWHVDEDAADMWLGIFPDILIKNYATI